MNTPFRSFAARSLSFLTRTAAVSVAALVPLALPLHYAWAGPELEAKLGRLINAGDWVGVEHELEQAWPGDPSGSRDAAAAIIRTASPVNRIVATAVTARNATPVELARLATSMKTVLWVDERRIVVRAIGARAAALSRLARDDSAAAALKAEAYSVLKPFLTDEDLTVQSAAIFSAADLGMGRVVGDFMNRLASIPAIDTAPPNGLDQLLQMAIGGACYELSGLRPSTSSDVQTWFHQTGGLTKTNLKYRTEDTRNTIPFVRSKDFDIYYYFGYQRVLPRSGWLAPEPVIAATDLAAQAAKDLMAPIVGPVHMPVVRLLLCDPAEFGPRSGGVSFMSGVTRANEIVIKADHPSTLSGGVVTHEYVHLIHGALFLNQPRWLSEGLATSLERSRQAPSTRKVPAPGSDARTIIDRGVFHDMVNWKSAASSDRLEPIRYSLACTVIDYLRFGGFSAPNERLNLLMGKISRGTSDQQALEETFGVKLADLDQRIRVWLAGN